MGTRRIAGVPDDRHRDQQEYPARCVVMPRCDLRIETSPKRLTARSRAPFAEGPTPRRQAAPEEVRHSMREPIRPHMGRQSVAGRN